MIDPTLTALRTAYPSHEWRIYSAGMYAGDAPMGKESATIAVCVMGRFFEAEVHASKVYRGLGTTAVNAVRIALSRAGLPS